MPRRSVVVSLLSLALAASGVRAADAQETPKPEASPRAEAAPSPSEKPAAARRDVPATRLRVQVVISRYRGETKVLSLPYTLVVTAAGLAPGHTARMRMGVQTPIPTGPSSAPGSDRPASYSYKNVGTNIDCTARESGDGRYLLRLSIEQSSVFGGEEAATGSAPEPVRMPGVPLFRSFDLTIEPMLRDGETQQIVASTDPITGEVLKIDVTLDVVK